MHASIRIGGAAIMMVEEAPEWKMLGPKALGGSPVATHVRDVAPAEMKEAMKAMKK
jgi:PhnB protein